MLAVVGVDVMRFAGEVPRRDRRSPGSEPSTQALIDRAKQGDHRAFSRLLRAADPKMYGLASALLGTEAAIDDALQDAYLEAYQGIGRFRGDAAFTTWLHTIVYRTCLRHLRTHRNRREVHFDAVPEPVVADRSNPTEWRAARHEIDQALGELPPDKAAAVVLVDVEGYSYKETAAILGVNEGTIASRLNRGRRALRHRLGSSDNGEGTAQ